MRKFRRYDRSVADRLPRLERLKAFVRHHPLGVPVATVGVLLAVTAVISGIVALVHHGDQAAPTARIVILSYDHKEQTVPSNEPTVGALIKKLNIPIHEGDVVEPSTNTAIKQDDFRINIYRAKPVKIIDSSAVTYSYSAATTSRSVASQAGVTLYPEDKLSTAPPEDFLRDYSLGSTVTVDRSIPVALNIYGAATPIRTHAKTVRELLDEKHVKLSKIDTLQPGLDTPITPDMPVNVIRNGVRTISEVHDIAMPVQTLNDPNLAYGTTAVRQQGSAGKQVVTYQINVQNGIEVNRTQLQAIVTVQPVAQIVARGINLGGIKGDMALAGISPNDFSYVDYIVQKESRWNPFARNASSGAYGLCQALPGSKMATAGSDWETNPVTQLKWCNSYAVSKYGSWHNAYNYWVSHHYW